MNKLEGFFFLKELGIPVVSWQEYTGKEEFDPRTLWTVRTALLKGVDIHLPRLVGAKAKQAEIFAKKMHMEFRNKGMVIFYPYFIAEKSGTLEVAGDYVVLEAVYKDLWNLVDGGKPDFSMKISKNEILLFQEEEGFDFIKQREEILSLVPVIRLKSRKILAQGNSVLLEWSYAKYTDAHKNPVGEASLVFYEIRELSF